ncbi:MAG: phospholipid-binding protein [Rhizobiaceae bacterium]|nr:phospholipid-binding protein [Rhizobiaceae bacterium]
MKNQFVAAATGIALLMVAPTSAQAFSLSFTWGNLKLCTSGRPNRVANPNFKLSGVPEGTTKIKFKMVDRNVPKYNHGGGSVKYTGQKTIAPGAFKYKSPCPPDGRHTYEWTATAIGKGGKKLGTAKSSKKYP